MKNAGMLPGDFYSDELAMDSDSTPPKSEAAAEQADQSHADADAPAQLPAPEPSDLVKVLVCSCHVCVESSALKDH